MTFNFSLKTRKYIISSCDIASCFVTTATDHQTEHTLSPGLCALAKCNNQPGIQYSGVNPTTSSALSLARTLLSVLHLNHLKTNDIIQVLFNVNVTFQNQIQKSTTHLIGFASVTVQFEYILTRNSIAFSCFGSPAVQFRDNGT